MSVSNIMVRIAIGDGTDLRKDGPSRQQSLSIRAKGPRGWPNHFLLALERMLYFL